ncbi:hypothetical protein CPB85DRAFT_113041 [Mucidula mucida]|nr:hypothetical protein CPB85DRAFT_113041 [Mucidula mucida]
MVNENTPLRRRNFSIRHFSGHVQRRYNAYKNHQTIAPGNLSRKRKQRKARVNNNITLKIKTFITSSLPTQPKQEATVPVLLPRQLIRPEPLSDDVTIPEMEDAPPQFVRDSFATCGPRLFRDLSMAQTHVDSTHARAIPTSIKVTVPGCEARPTHVLAAFAPKTSNVTLFPVHDVVLAAHCENYPRMVVTEPLPAEHVPVQPFCLPHPPSYGPLSQYLYTHRQDVLFSTLCAPMPAPKFFPSQAHVSTSEPLSLSMEDMRVFARELSETYTQHKLLQSISTIHGLYKNVVALGIHDDGLWEVLDVLWGVYLTAVGWKVEGIATGEVLPNFSAEN